MLNLEKFIDPQKLGNLKVVSYHRRRVAPTRSPSAVGTSSLLKEEFRLSILFLQYTQSNVKDSRVCNKADTHWIGPSSKRIK